MSDSVRPHRWKPNRLPSPWDSPGKNAGVGCHFLLQCMKVKSEREVAQLCPTPSNLMDCSPPGPSAHGIFQARVLEWGAIAFSGGLTNLLQIQKTRQPAQVSKLYLRHECCKCIRPQEEKRNQASLPNSSPAQPSDHSNSLSFSSKPTFPPQVCPPLFS